MNKKPNGIARSMSARVMAALLAFVLASGLIGAAPLRAQTATPASEPAADSASPDKAAAPSAIHSVTIQASQDSYISSGNPNTNFGGASNLNLGWQNGNQNAMRMLLQWDLSSIPRNAVIQDARYELYQTQVIPVGDRNMDFLAQFMSQSWSEMAVTWNNANFLGGQTLSFGSIPSTFGWVGGNATDVVKAWVSGSAPNNGVMVTGDEIPSNNRMRIFASRQGGNAPRLIVNYTVNCDNVPPTATVQALPRFSGASFTVSWTGQDFAPSGCTPSGVANYDVQYRINNGPWTDWRTRTTQTSRTFSGIAPNGAFVEFRARATDNAGNVGAYTGAQANTTIDTEPPVASMLALQPVQTFVSFPVFWSGTDNLSGIASYDVEFQANSGAWQPLVSGTTATTFQVTGAQPLTTYGFRARATDNAGNVQTWPLEAQAETIVINYPVVLLNPIEPPIIKPTSPVTTSISLSWVGFTAPDTTISSYQVFFGVNGGTRTLWQTFPGTTLTAVFPIPNGGDPKADGMYTFEVTAVNSLGQQSDRNGPAAFLAIQNTIVDLADQVKPAQYMPFVAEVGDR